MIRCLITTHGHLEGVRLTIFGDRGNLPFPDDAAAVAYATKAAKGRPHTIERQRCPALGYYRSADDARK